ncbi:hypothetical protein ACHAXR_010043 [Thalassiosira sp. AJA248-18]
MTAASTPPLHVLRGIMRLIKTSPSKPMPVSTAPAAVAAAARSSESSQPTNTSELTLGQHIILQYRQSQSLPPYKAKIQRQIAYDYFILKQDLTERARLHELDQGADEKLSPKELNRRSAARAGLQLPKLDSE